MFNRLNIGGGMAELICDDLFIGLEQEADRRELSPFEKAMYARLKQYEVNSREAHENFFNTLAQGPGEAIGEDLLD